jgi:hypothetical protein
LHIWEAAAWAAIGSAANIGVVYCEAQARIKGGWPWQVEHGGVGGIQTLVEILIKIAVSVAVVAALSTNPSVLPNAWTALVFGIGGPSIVKKAAQFYAENKLQPAAAPPTTAGPDLPGISTHPPLDR